MSLFNNFMLKSDSYKHSHHKMYPKNTESVYSYFACRGGPWEEVVHYGLHPILKKHFEGVVVRPEDVVAAKRIIDAHIGPGIFNKEGWNYIATEREGKLPLEIKALPEGTIVPNGNVMVTVENTDSKCAFLTNFVETILVHLWDPCSVASNSREMFKIINKYLIKTSDDFSGLVYKLHDFGFRGVSCVEEASIAGSAHLVNGMGTDTLVALIVAIEYYNAKGMPGRSIPATEHSIMCAWTKAGEFDGIENLLRTYSVGLVAGVSDTWSIYNACEKYANEMKELIMSRDGTFVVRPDSGYPPEVVVKCLEILWEGYKNEGIMVGPNKNYKLLPPQIRMIQGDGIDIEMLEKILQAVALAGFSTDNLAFGSGGGLIRKVDRDTLKIAFKASSYVINGKRVDERKEPVTDSGKRSKLGRFKVVKDVLTGKLITVQEEDPRPDLLETVFLNGEILVHPQWEDIKERAKLVD